MSLRHARPLNGNVLQLPQGPPYSCEELRDWAGVAFDLPAGDPRLLEIHRGELTKEGPLDNLVGAVRYWETNPEWMAFLEPSSPAYRDKLIERGLYLDLWESHIPPKSRVLDLGGGVGRFTQWLLDRGCDVELVDPDLRSLWRAVTHAVGRPGRLDVHWSTGERLPPISKVDVVIASEVLCYAEDPRAVLRNVSDVLKPGGILLASVEARWGWAMSTDVYPGSIDGFFTGRVHVPGELWVQTFTEVEFRDLLSGYEVIDLQPSHYAFSGPFELATSQMSIDQALTLEQRLREHAMASRLNRIWMATVRRPPNNDG